MIINEILKNFIQTGTVATVVAGLINSYGQKQWKCIKQNSSSDNACLLFLKSLFLAFFGICYYYTLLKFFPIDNLIVRIIVTLIYMICGVAIVLYENKLGDKFRIKKWIPEILTNFLKKSSIVASVFSAIFIALMYIWIDCTIVYWSSVGFCILFLVLTLFCLDKSKNYKYKYAILYFNRNEKTNTIKVKVETLSQKGKWIIATKSDDIKEYRIKTQDLIQVDYTND